MEKFISGEFGHCSLTQLIDIGSEIFRCSVLEEPRSAGSVFPIITCTDEDEKDRPVILIEK